MLASRLAFTRLAKFVFYVNFQIRFGNRVERDRDSAAGSILKDDAISFETNYAATKISLVSDGEARLEFCGTPRKTVSPGRVT